MNHRIDIQLLRPGRYRASFLGEPIGEWRVPECDAARWLIAYGAALDDTLTTYRGDTLCFTGQVAWLAARTVMESDKFGPRWRKWEPHPGIAPPASRGSAQDGQEENPGV
jgi:hypothetical protein